MISARESVRVMIGRKVVDTVHGGDLHLELYDHPVGDQGLLGAGSVAWRVHADPAGMLTGGFAALLLQTLHPLAMAGVTDHSNWREDPIDRLRRTAGFVTVSSFGSTEAAEAAVEKVKQVHSFVKGTAADGRPYSAADPELLTWVHVAEVSSFLAGFEKFGVGRRLTADERDRYYAEVSVIAERLGATDVPKSVAGIEKYFTAIRPDLVATPEAVATAGHLRRTGTDQAQRIAIRTLMNGAIWLLPPWARRLLRISRPAPIGAVLDRPVALAVGRTLHWACQPQLIIETAHARALSAVGSTFQQ